VRRLRRRGMGAMQEPHGILAGARMPWGFLCLTSSRSPATHMYECGKGGRRRRPAHLEEVCLFSPRLRERQRPKPGVMEIGVMGLRRSPEKEKTWASSRTKIMVGCRVTPGSPRSLALAAGNLGLNKRTSSRVAEHLRCSSLALLSSPQKTTAGCDPRRGGTPKEYNCFGVTPFLQKNLTGK